MKAIQKRWITPNIKDVLTKVYNELVSTYPEITMEEVAECIDSEFKMCKEELSKGEVGDYNSYTKEVWLQYFATFVMKREDKTTKVFNTILKKKALRDESNTKLQ